MTANEIIEQIRHRKRAFRYFNMVTKKMVYSDEYLVLLGFFKKYHNAGEYHGYDKIRLMDYAGLIDKDKNYIYEGDIVECNRYREREKYIVVINDIRQLDINLFGSELNYRKILGNVFENPELIG